MISSNMKVTTYRYIFDAYKGTYYSPQIGMFIERYLGVPEVVAMVHSPYFHSLRFGDHSVEYFVLKTPHGTIEIKEIHRSL